MKKSVLYMVVLLKEAMVDAAQQPRPGGRRQSIDASALQAKMLVHTEVEKRIMIVLDDLDQNHRQGNMNVPVEDGRLLRLLTETTNAKHVVEIGTSNGYSGLWFRVARQKAGRHLATAEIDRGRGDRPVASFRRGGVERDGSLILGDGHERVAGLMLDGPFDILFLDADKEGFLRSKRSLIQTCGRASRNVRGQVIMYADLVTRSMKQAIDETDRRRKIQTAYNKKHSITQESIEKDITSIFGEMYKQKDEHKYIVSESMTNTIL